MTDLHTFISSTIQQIMMAVDEAGYIVNTMPYAQAGYVMVGGDDTSGLEFVEFDIAVTYSDTSSSEVAGGLKIQVLSLGGGTKESFENQSINRIRFKVPVSYPGKQNKKWEKKPLN